MIFEWPEWYARAACKGQMELMLGKPDPGPPYFEEEAARIEKAKEVCAGCPVVLECLKYALQEEPSDGVWGHMTYEERLHLCPVCYGPKPDITELGCCDTCTELRMAEYEELAALRMWDVRQPTQQTNQWGSPRRATMRTSPYCLAPRGVNHSSESAYMNDGCRCAAARGAHAHNRREAKKGAK